MDWASALSGVAGQAMGGGGGGIAGGGGGYSGEIKSDIKSGGTNTGTFGAINFGAGASVGGATTATGAESSNKILLYVGIGVIALVGILVLVKR